MAEQPTFRLEFRGTCPDCGVRAFTPPPRLPRIGDDFDWGARDYDGLRVFMLEELAARFPERTRWTPADVEVVLIETLATVLDQQFDKLDRVTAEACLETARQPDSVRRLLDMIGFDAVLGALVRGEIQGPDELEKYRQGDKDTIVAARVELARFWRDHPQAIDTARREGPRALRTQRRMVTIGDYGTRLSDHPLVERAHAWSRWTGAWHTIEIAVIGRGNRLLDKPGPFATETRKEVDEFNKARRIEVEWDKHPTLRAVLRPYLEAYRMLGQEVLVTDAVLVGISMSLSVRVASNCFQSEVRRAILEVLGTGDSGFFRPGWLRFGEDLHTSDVVAVLMALDGVENVCLNRFKRIGAEYPDRAGTGTIPLDGIEVALCDNNPRDPRRGYYRLILHGGLKG